MHTHSPGLPLALGRVHASYHGVHCLPEDGHPPARLAERDELLQGLGQAGDTSHPVLRVVQAQEESPARRSCRAVTRRGVACSDLKAGLGLEELGV